MKNNISIPIQSKLDSYFKIQNSNKAATRRKQVFEFLMSVDDATDWEIAKYLGYNERNSVAPRRNELVSEGLVKAVSQRLCKVSNNKVTAWRVI